MVLDGTFARSDHRRRALSELRELYGQCIVVHVMCDIDTARRRNASRRAVVPEDRLRGIYAHFEEPLSALKINTDTHSAEENASIILSSLTRGT